MAMAFRAMTDHLHERLAELGREAIRPAHGFTFRYLADHPGATTVDIAAHLGVTKQAASKTVNELEEWGYVRRRPHPTDGRAHVVTLTRRGRSFLELADELWGESEDEWRELIGSQKLEDVRRALHAYVDHAAETGRSGLRPLW